MAYSTAVTSKCYGHATLWQWQSLLLPTQAQSLSSSVIQHEGKTWVCNICTEVYSTFLGERIFGLEVQNTYWSDIKKNDNQELFLKGNSQGKGKRKYARNSRSGTEDTLGHALMDKEGRGCRRSICVGVALMRGVRSGRYSWGRHGSGQQQKTKEGYCTTTVEGGGGLGWTSSWSYMLQRRTHTQNKVNWLIVWLWRILYEANNHSRPNAADGCLPMVCCFPYSHCESFLTAVANPSSPEGQGGLQRVVIQHMITKNAKAAVKNFIKKGCLRTSHQPEQKQGEWEGA